MSTSVATTTDKSESTRYYRRVRSTLWKDFRASTNAQLVRIGIAVAALICGIVFGVVHGSDVGGHVWALVVPYAGLLLALFIWHLFRASFKLDQQRQAEIDSRNAKVLLLQSQIDELNAGPKFDGCVYRSFKGMSAATPLVNLQVFRSIVQATGQRLLCDCDLLVELMIENRAPSLASIITAELRLETADGKFLSAFAEQDLSHYALRAESDPPLPHFMASEELIPFVNLFNQMTTDAPIQQGHKIEGWLRFKFPEIDPDDLDTAKSQTVVIHDSLLREHLITKHLNIKRQGAMIVVKPQFMSA
jgi:hypothetical protein